MRQTFYLRARSIAGAALVGLGIFIFCENVARAANQLSHLRGTVPWEAQGSVPVILAASRVVQAYAGDHRRFLHSLLQHVLVSFWPLVLVAVGTRVSRMAWTRDGFTDDVNAHPKKDCGLVDLSGGRSTSK